MTVTETSIEVDIVTISGDAAPLPPRRPFRRVVLKLGGEMFGGGEVGVDPEVVSEVARQIAEIVHDGVQVARGDRRWQLLPRRPAAGAWHGPGRARTTWACSAR